MIDWQSSESHWLINPRSTQQEKSWIENARRPNLPGHVWLATSGSTAQQKAKWVALAKSAILSGAAACNRHLQANGNDIWIKILPDFHIGGLAIWARAQLAGSQVVDVVEHWQSHEFVELAMEHEATLSALVPTHIYDLVKNKIKSPPNLRAVVVGGGALSKELYLQARALGWPLLPSYGLTECSSQVATAELSSLECSNEYPPLKMLDHVLVEQSDSGKLRLRSEALLSCYYRVDGLTGTEEMWDPKDNGWFETEDMGSVVDGAVTVSGRATHVVKVGGELVNLSWLQQEWQSTESDLSSKSHLLAVPCPRLGSRVVLVVAESAENSVRVNSFNDRVRPFERIREVYFVEQIPRSPLGKVLEGELRDQLGL